MFDISLLLLILLPSVPAKPVRRDFEYSMRIISAFDAQCLGLPDAADTDYVASGDCHDAAMWDIPIPSSSRGPIVFELTNQTLCADLWEGGLLHVRLSILEPRYSRLRRFIDNRLEHTSRHTVSSHRSLSRMSDPSVPDETP
jgi:hypothetical protein